MDDFWCVRPVCSVNLGIFSATLASSIIDYFDINIDGNHGRISLDQLPSQEQQHEGTSKMICFK